MWHHACGIGRYAATLPFPAHRMTAYRAGRPAKGTRYLAAWFGIVAAIQVGWGIVFAFFGLGVLSIVPRAVLLRWESALYGSIMIGWGVTLFLVGRLAFRRGDPELMRILLAGIALWLVIEAIFSAWLGVWFNAGVDIAVLVLFGFPLIKAIRHNSNFG